MVDLFDAGYFDFAIIVVLSLDREAFQVKLVLCFHNLTLLMEKKKKKRKLLEFILRFTFCLSDGFVKFSFELSDLKSKNESHILTVFYNLYVLFD